MSDTPKRDKQKERELMDALTPFVTPNRTEKLQRELTAANRKIQRLVEAGDELLVGVRYSCTKDFIAKMISKWTAAKEEKAS